MRELFLAFLQSPSRDTYLAVRSALISGPAYDPYARDILDVVELIEQERFIDADELLRAAMPNLLLSPRAHLCAAMIAEEAGDEERRRMEGAVAYACVQGILSTGDGTKQHPYVVTRTSDEYDVLQFLDKELGGQSLCEEGDRHYDLLRCKDGSEMWFDVTDPYGKLGDQLGK